MSGKVDRRIADGESVYQIVDGQGNMVDAVWADGVTEEWAIDWLNQTARRMGKGLAVYKSTKIAISQHLNYDDYIQSKDWRERADAAKERAGHRCQVCYSPDQLDAHHRTYERLGNELPSDITVLCRNCHTLFHKSGRMR